MSERATRPLNNGAVKAADDEIYANHADDPRPNALFDENGNRKALSATDPAQADLRAEWMASYKAHGGQTESTDSSSGSPAQTTPDCDPRVQVDPLIIGDDLELDESEIPEEPAESEDESKSEDETEAGDSASSDEGEQSA